MSRNNKWRIIKMKSTDERYELVMRMMSHIHNSKRKTKSELVAEIPEMAGYSEKTIDRLMQDVTGKTLKQYIDDVRYQYAEEKMQANNLKLNNRQAYQGIPYFKQNLERRKAKGNYTDVILTSDMLEATREVLTSRFVEAHNIKAGKIKLTMDFDEMLIPLLSLPRCLVSKQVVDITNYFQLDKDDKICVLILNKDGYTIKRSAEGIDFSFNKFPDVYSEEFWNDYKMYNLYNLDHPTILGDTYMFVPKLLDAFRPAFENQIDWILNHKGLFEIEDFGNDFEKYKPICTAIKQCWRQCTIDTLAGLCDITKEEVLDLLWDMMKQGLICIR